MRRIRAGDSESARVLFDRHLPALRARVRRRLPPTLRAKVSASDVVQDAYLAAFERIGEFREQGDGSFGRWLRRIVENKIVDEIRRHVEAAKRDARREVRLPTGNEAKVPENRRRSPSAEFVAAEDAAALRAAIANLPSDHAAVVRWIHLEGLTAAEVGARMGRTADAVRKLYARALARLADRLDEPAGGGA